MGQRRGGLVSVGYEGRTSEELLNTLVELGVTTLVDVRLTPLSRKPGLSKTRLSASSDAAGVRYIHLSALGNPKNNRDPFREGRAQEVAFDSVHYWPGRPPWRRWTNSRRLRETVAGRFFASNETTIDATAK